MSPREDAAPIWARPEPGSRRPRFTRERIAAAAIAIADAEGFSAVSMRRVAAELGAATMSLYHYLRSKDELLALIDDALMGEATLPPDQLPAEWRPAITAIARRTRDVFLRHRWALRATQGEGAVQSAPISPNAMAHFEQSLAALEGAPLGALAKVELLGAVDDYVFGHVMRAGEQEARAAGADGAYVQAMMAYGMEQLRSGRYPQLEALAREPAATAALSDPREAERRFERGLNMLLDGAAGHAPVGPALPDPEPSAGRA